MEHSQASRIFRREAARLPQHRMHVLARFQVCRYLSRRYRHAQRHAKRLALALEREDARLVAQMQCCEEPTHGEPEIRSFTPTLTA